ncbi:hypothetical protein ACROYT_G007560 [Oculina patagonica]
MEDIGYGFSGYEGGSSFGADRSCQNNSGFSSQTGFQGCDGGLSFGADSSFQSFSGISSKTAFRGGSDLDLGQLQFPNRLARKFVQSHAPRTNQLGDVVLQAPGAPGLPLQNVNATQQMLHSSLTTINNRQRPVVVQPAIPPKTWMGMSIFSVIFCTPFGILAVLFSCRVSTLVLLACLFL